MKPRRAGAGHRRPTVVLLSVVALASLTTAVGLAGSRGARVGALHQLRGARGCISRSGRLGCARGRALLGLDAVAISPDGRSVYTVAALSNALAVFARDGRSGALRQLPGRAGCVQRSSKFGCGRGRGLGEPEGVAVSPDGRSVYATAFDDDVLAIFARNRRTGALRQLSGTAGCVAGRDKRGCATARALVRPRAVTVSLDGRSVYVAASSFSADGALAVFARDPGTGAIRQLPGPSGCASEPEDQGCAPGRALAGLSSIAVSPDGRGVYVAAFDSDAVAIFARDLGTGAVLQLPSRAGCVSERAKEGCARGRGLGGADSVAVSPDGRSVYATGPYINALAVFGRSPGTSALRQLPGRAGCIQRSGRFACARGRGLGGFESLAVSPDGRNVYAVAGDNDAVAVFAR